MYSECLKNYTRRSHHEIQLPDDSRGGELGVPGTYADSRLQIAPWRPEKIHGTWDSTYIRRNPLFLYFQEDLQVCWGMECSFEHFVTESRRVTLSEMLSTALAYLPENTGKVYAYVYRCYPMSHEFFRVFRVQFGVLSQHMYRERPIHHPGSPRLLSGNCISWWDPFVYFLSHPEYIYNSIPKNSESIWWTEKKIQKSNSASMCKFRPVGHHSIETLNADSEYLVSDKVSTCQTQTNFVCCSAGASIRGVRVYRRYQYRRVDIATATDPIMMRSKS